MASAWLFPDFEKSVRQAVSFGVSISFALSLAGFLLLAGSRQAGTRKFIRLVLGGMAARMIAALAAVAAGLGLFHLPAGTFVGSCLVSYVVFMGLEHFYLLPLLDSQGQIDARNGNA